MMVLILLVVLLGAGAALWFQGLWSNVLNFVHLLIAGVLAFSLTEPITTWLDGQARAYGYLTDFIVMWVLFAVLFGLLRAFTDTISRTRIRFHPMVELIGRSVMSLVNAYLVLMFVAASLHSAPLAARPFNARPPSLLGLRPDGHFFDYTSLLSRGSLAGTNTFNGPQHVRAMDSRRRDFERMEEFLAP